MRLKCGNEEDPQNTVLTEVLAATSEANDILSHTACMRMPARVD